jgi:hypothetical protein
LPLRLTPVPKKIEKALGAILASYSRFLQENPKLPVEGAALSERSIRQCLPVYVAKSPSPPASRRPRKRKSQSWFKPKQIAWRFFLETNQGVNAAVEVHLGYTAKAHHQFQHGEFIQRTFDSVKKARRNKRLRRQHYSLRLLHVPPLHFSSLWVRPVRGRDIFVPFTNFSGELRAGSFRTQSEICRALVNSAAEKRKAHQDLLTRRKQSLAERRSD